ncbi:MAG: hypothetical protein ACK5IC_08310 [Moheibacter sp.]
MKTTPFALYIIGFVAVISIGYFIGQFMLAITFGLLYAILLGILVAISGLDPIEKSKYNKRKKKES